MNLPELETLSRMNYDKVLDDEIMMEEIEYTIRRIKRGKRGGLDNVSAEHLQYGGEFLKIWLKQVFNAIITLEEIPNYLKVSLFIRAREKTPWRPLVLEWSSHE